MQKELTGKNGRIVGSSSYFRDLNERYYVGILMKEKDSSNYYDVLRGMVGKINAVFDEVYGDLLKHAKILRYLPKTDRENLRMVLEGLAELVNITSSVGGRYRDCLALLSLSARETRPQTAANERDIESAAKVILDGKTMSKGNGLDLVKKAIEYSTNYAVGGDPKKAAFLQEVSKGKDKGFLQAVWTKVYYEMNPGRATGRCGNVICSRQYIDHIKRHALGTAIANRYGGSFGERKYGKLFLTGLKEIAKTLEQDIIGVRHIQRECLNSNNKTRVLLTVKQLEKCGISVSRQVEEIIIKMYTEIEYFGEPPQNMEEFAEYNKPDKGVVGFGAGVGGGIGWYGSLEGMIVIDSYGNYGFIRIFGVGGGFGANLDVCSLEFKNIDTIFELESKKAFDLGAILSVSFGPLSFGSRFWKNEANMGPSFSVVETIKDVSLRSENFSFKPGISLNGQVQHYKLIWYKKVKK